MVMLMDYPDVLAQSLPIVKDRKFHTNTEIHPFMQQLECCPVLPPLKPLKKSFKNDDKCSWFASIPKVEITESQKSDPDIGIIDKWKREILYLSYEFKNQILLVTVGQNCHRK